MSLIRKQISSGFSVFARHLSIWAGRPSAFFGAFTLIVIWAFFGPAFGFSDTWQLIVNTSTTIVTFLMVFLIQHTQNRDTEEIQIKLNELIRATKGAHNLIVGIDQWDDEELEAQIKRYDAIAAEARRRVKRGLADEDCPTVVPPTPGSQGSG